MENLMTKGYAEKVPDCELIEQKNGLIIVFASPCCKSSTKAR